MNSDCTKTVGPCTCGAWHSEAEVEELRVEDACEHAEHDHFICLDCGEELDPGEAIDRAMDYGEER